MITLEYAVELQNAIEYLNSLPQRSSDGEELTIGKNDPKNGDSDYFFAYYGCVRLSGYYSLTKLLIDLADDIKKYNAERKEEK